MILYVKTNTKDIYENLAAEYYLATESELFEKTGCDTVLLFWQTTPTIVVGKFQNVYEEVNLDYTREHNINIVRRMSGGGTMYMDEGGWQYSFISCKDSDSISFTEYMEPVLAALHSLGLDAEFTGRNDIMTAGKKVSGNSQYKLGGKTVHHGTFLFDTDLEKIVHSTSPADHKIISKGIKSVRERVTNIAEHLQSVPTSEQFRELMTMHIMGKDGKMCEFTEAEKERVAEIAAEKFRNWDAIYGAAPKFSITKTAHLKGGHVELHFDVKKGIIADCAIYGDFFAAVDAGEIKKALCGCKYQREAIADALINAGLKNAFYNITPEEIAAVME